MGQVLELKQRISGDWSVVERVHLDQLVSMLPAALAQDIEFGVSDAGDPWCAVMNGEGEVVLHVARIAGRFFVHSTVEPFVADSHDLPTAVAPFIGDGFLERRHVASITPLYGLMMPLHAYAPPGSLLEQPDGDWLDVAVAPPAEAVTPVLPEAPEVWSAPVFQLVTTADAPRLGATSEADVALFPIQESDWTVPASGQLLEFSAVARMEAAASIEREDVSFEAFFQLLQPTSAEQNVAAAPTAPAPGDDPPTDLTTGATDPGGRPASDDGPAPDEGNVVNVDFGNGGFTAANTGAGALEGLERAAGGSELVISDLDPGVIVAWTDQPNGLMGVAPSAEAF